MTFALNQEDLESLILSYLTDSRDGKALRVTLTLFPSGIKR